MLSNLLIVVGVALLAAAGYLWGKAQWGYHEQDVVNKRLQEYVTVVEESDDTPDGPVGPQVDWAGLKKVNDEVVGWLQIPGTVVNYPVYQHSDNDYYLDYNAEGVITVGGQLFMDYEGTRPGLVDQSTLIYGHHQKDGSMFQAVAKLDDQEAFDATETVWYVTEGQTYELEPLLLYYTQPDDQDVRKFTFKSKAQFTKHLKGLVDKAKTKRSDAAQLAEQAEHVLCLITCNYYDGYGRTVLVCMPKSEAQTSA